MSDAKRILIAEDEKPLNHALSLKLGHEGYAVDSAFNGEEALALVQKNKYDLILLDLIMPKVDGFGVLEKLKGKPDLPPIVVLSNLGQPEDKTRSQELGANDFFIKADTPLSQIVEMVKSKLNSE